MIHRNRARSSSLFLMELIIAIFFFTIFSAVCVQVFVKAHLMNQESFALNHAVSECSGVAEVISTSDSVDVAVDTLEDLHPYGRYDNRNGNATNVDAEIYYDADFKECSKDKAEYLLLMKLDSDEHMINADMSVRPVGSKEADSKTTGSKKTKPVESDSKASGDTASGNKTTIYELSTTHHIARRTR